MQNTKQRSPAERSSTLKAVPFFTQLTER